MLRVPGVLCRYRFSLVSQSGYLRTFSKVVALAVVLSAFTVPGNAQQASSQAGNTQTLPDAPSGPTATISGTVLDPNGSIIEGARVELTSMNGVSEQVVKTGENGQFHFSGLGTGTFKVTVTGPGMGIYVSPEISVTGGEFRMISGVVLPVATETSSVTVSGDPEVIAEEEVQIEIQQRVLGVFPNFYTSYDWNAGPLFKKQKFELAFHAVTDPVSFAGAGILAGLQQGNHMYPGYEYGFEGYSRRYAAAFANDAIGRVLASAVLPSLLHQDPRYFYKGTGSIRSRATYAILSTVICRGDNGKRQPNVSQIFGKLATGAISNLYYPAANRGPGLVLTTAMIETVGSMGNNILREFLYKRWSNQPKDPGN